MKVSKVMENITQGHASPQVLETPQKKRTPHSHYKRHDPIYFKGSWRLTTTRKVVTVGDWMGRV